MFFLTVPPGLVCGSLSKSSILLAVLKLVPGLDGGPDGRFGGMSVGGIFSSSNPGVPLLAGVADLDPGADGGGMLELLCPGVEVGGLVPGAEYECGKLDPSWPNAWFAATLFPLTLRDGGPVFGGGGVALGADAVSVPAFLLTHFPSSVS